MPYALSSAPYSNSRVTPCCEPGAAGKTLRLSQEYASRIDLLITDVIMPAMSGSELAKQ